MVAAAAPPPGAEVGVESWGLGRAGGDGRDSAGVSTARVGARRAAGAESLTGRAEHIVLNESLHETNA